MHVIVDQTFGRAVGALRRSSERLALVERCPRHSTRHPDRYLALRVAYLTYLVADRGAYPETAEGESNALRERLGCSRFVDDHNFLILRGGQWSRDSPQRARKSLFTSGFVNRANPPPTSRSERLISHSMSSKPTSSPVPDSAGLTVLGAARGRQALRSGAYRCCRYRAKLDTGRGNDRHISPSTIR